MPATGFVKAPWVTPEPWVRAQNLLLSRLTPAQVGCIRQMRCLPVRSSMGSCYLIGAYAGEPSGIFYFDSEVKVLRVRFNRRGRIKSVHRHCVYAQDYLSVPPPDKLYSLMRTIETDVIHFRMVAVDQGQSYGYEHRLATWLDREAFLAICPERRQPPRVRIIDWWLRMMFGSLATE